MAARGKQPYHRSTTVPEQKGTSPLGQQRHDVRVKDCRGRYQVGKQENGHAFEEVKMSPSETYRLAMRREGGQARASQAWSRVLHIHSPIDVKRLAIDVGGIVGGQEGHHAGHLLRQAATPLGDP